MCFGILKQAVYLFFPAVFCFGYSVLFVFAPELSGRDKDETYSYVVHHIELCETLTGATLLLWLLLVLSIAGNAHTASIPHGTGREKFTKYLEDTLRDMAAIRFRSEFTKRNASFIGRNYLKGSSRFSKGIFLQ